MVLFEIVKLFYPLKDIVEKVLQGVTVFETIKKEDLQMVDIIIVETKMTTINSHSTSKHYTPQIGLLSN